MTADVWERLGVEAGLKHYIEVRNRLQRPPNAVPDIEIDLRRRPPKDPQANPPELATLPSPTLEERSASRIAEILALYPPLPKKRLSISTITDCVAESFGLTPAEIRFESRRPKYVFPRQIAMYLAHRMTTKSYPEIGHAFKFDHSTIIHHCRKITDRLRLDSSLTARIDAIEVLIKARYADQY